jgi:quinolinate synthase
MRKVADFIGSTSKMCKYAKDHLLKNSRRNRKRYSTSLAEGKPGKKFYVSYDGAVCPNMKLTTLDRVYTSLKEEKP